MMARTVRTIALPIALAVVLLAAGQASAATMFKNGDTLQFDRQGATGNDLSVDYCGTCNPKEFRFHLAAGPLTAGAGCTQNGGDVTCLTTGVARLFFPFAGGDDHLRVDQGAVSNGVTPLPIAAVGGDGNDELQGGSGADFLGGGANDDVISAGAGNDQINPVNGSNPADNADGNDTLIGGPDRDTINGGSGIDTVSYDDGRVNGVTVTLGDNTTNDGGPEDDPNPALRDSLIGIENAVGSANPDVLVGSDGGNALIGRAGDDVFDGGSGADTVDGGDGSDRVSYAGRTTPVSVNLGAPGPNNGSDVDGPPGARDVAVNVEGAIGGEAGDILIAAATGSALSGQGGNDLITGGAAGDALDGGTGNDTIDGGAGADTYTGGDGDDTIRAADGVPESVNCGPGASDFAATDANDTRIECELPLPPPPPPELRTQGTNVTFTFFPSKPRKTTRFEDWKIHSVPKGSKVAGQCLTKKGKRCSGKLRKRFTKKKARGSFKLKTFNKKYRAGQKIDIVITNPDFKTKVLTTKIRRNKRPLVVVRCITPPSKKRKPC